MNIPVRVGFKANSPARVGFIFKETDHLSEDKNNSIDLYTTKSL